MLEKVRRSLPAVALVLGISASAGSAQAAGVKVGVLTCNVASGWGYIFGSSKEIRCNYVPDEGGNDHYFGKVSKLGIDVGYTEGGVLIWNVIAPSSDLDPGALEGEYGGISASATVGIGLGANVLVGGFDKSIALQPVSIEGNSGLNIAAGITGMTLNHDES